MPAAELPRPARAPRVDLAAELPAPEALRRLRPIAPPAAVGTVDPRVLRLQDGHATLDAPADRG